MSGDLGRAMAFAVWVCVVLALVGRCAWWGVGCPRLLAVWERVMTTPVQDKETCSLCGDVIEGAPCGAPAHPDQPLCPQCSLDCINGLHEHHIVEDA